MISYNTLIIASAFKIFWYLLFNTLLYTKLKFILNIKVFIDEIFLLHIFSEWDKLHTQNEMLEVFYFLIVQMLNTLQPFCYIWYMC